MRSYRLHRSLFTLLIPLFVLGLNPWGAAQAQEADARDQALALWEKYIHYLRVANLEMANSHAQALLELDVADEDLLMVVDELAPYRDWDRTLQTAQRIQELEGAVAELAAAVENHIQEARLNLARDGTRIRRNIELLDEGLRPRINATARLKRAGEYAAPELLKVLLSDTRTDEALRPHVREVMVEIGRPLVIPLGESLRYLPSVPKQQVAEVLARIGYPAALPFLRAELVREDVDDRTRQVLGVAFDSIARRAALSPGVAPDTLFLMLGEDYYNDRAGLVLEPGARANLMWRYTSGVGLVPYEIPTAVFRDVMAMRAASRALELNRESASATSLWLAANFRRENNLGEETDPSYGPERQSAHYYATIAGPVHVQPILARALTDGDAELALDAIRVLDATATTAERIGRDVQPLIAAMSYPDRRVRFEAAFALADSLPRVDFAGAKRVVPVLSEALRETALPYAMILGTSQEVINTMRTAAFGDRPEYQFILGESFDAVAQQVVTVPGVDVIVINLSPAQAQAAVATIRNHYKLTNTPILVVAPPDRVPTVTHTFADYQNVRVTSEGATSDEMAAAVEELRSRMEGSTIGEEQALVYAVTALNVLLDLAADTGAPFRAVEAKPALTEALRDHREPVVLGAARVLAQFEAADAQQAVAEAALDAERVPEMQAMLLRTLAESARIHGNLLTDGQINLLLRLVRQTEGDLANAAAEAHGALDLPTSNAVQFILQE